MPEAGLVSVVMPAWNAAGTIARSIESVLGQRHAQFELLVVDDASTDATAQLVDGYAMADARVRLIRQPANGGVAAARNTGIAAARGEYVAFLDSDDWWHPAKLERQLAQMRRENAQVSYCSYQRVAEDGRVLSLVVPPREVTHAQMLRSNFIGNLTGMYARSLGNGEFLRIGHEDYVFWLQMVRRAGRAIRIEHDGPLAFYLVREGSVSSNKWRAARWQWRIYREVEGLSRVRASVCMLYYFVYALSKRR
ncbi:MAG TPA: glycosyltransferase family 2 protein [Dokdonella sp.]